MVHKLGKDELADFDPAAPPPPKRGGGAPDDSLSRRNARAKIILGVCMILLAGLLWYYFAPRAANPLRLVAITPGSPVMSLAGPAFDALGRLEGPFTLMDVPGSSRVSLAGSGGPAETFQLIGLNVPDYLLPGQIAALRPEEAKARDQKLQALEAYRIAGLKAICGTKSHFIMRLSAAAPGQPSLIYLIQPISETNTSSDFAHPNGQGNLINAMALRQGKALMDLRGTYQPLVEQMVNCQLAAYAEAQKARAANRELDSIWTKFDLNFPMTPPQRDQLAKFEAAIY